MQQSKRQRLLVLPLAMSLLLDGTERAAWPQATETPPPAQQPAPATPAPSPAAPEQTAQETPESVAARYMEAMRRGDWKTCAELMHPDALAQLKRLFRPLVAGDQGRTVGTLFFNVRTPAEYERLTEPQAFERLMRGLIQMMPDMRAMMGASSFNIVGHVPEAPDVAHVVYRMKMSTQGIEMTKTTVMSLRRSGTSWRGLLTGDIEGLAAAFARMGASSPAAKPSGKPPAKPSTKAVPGKTSPKQTPGKRK